MTTQQKIKYWEYQISQLNQSPNNTGIPAYIMQAIFEEKIKQAAKEMAKKGK